jgi:SAM-dependent methyltransferase
MSFQDAHGPELEHHEALYSGFAQEHFAKPAVRAFRRHLVARILRVTGASSSSSVLSLGCGIGDTELLLAPSVKKIVGLDLSPAGIRQAKLDAERAGIANAEFLQGDLESARFPEPSFDIAIAVFFLHHLQDQQLHELVRLLAPLLSSKGVFYSLDPNRYRLSGAIGRLLVPNQMKKYQTPDERQLVPSAIEKFFAGHGFTARYRMYDFLSTPLAGLFPSARLAYRVARLLDNVLVRTPLLNRIGSNFELLAQRRDLFR